MNLPWTAKNGSGRLIKNVAFALGLGLLPTGCISLPTVRLPWRPQATTPATVAGDPDDANWYAKGLAANRARWQAREDRRVEEAEQAQEAALARRSARGSEIKVALERPAPLSAQDLVAITGPGSKPKPAPAPADWSGAIGATGSNPNRGLATRRPATSRPLAGAKPVAAQMSDLEAIAKILENARHKLDGMNNYQLTMVGQERLAGVLSPTEELVLSVQREPKAVRIEWLKGSHKGREVLYQTEGDDQLMHVNMADMGILGPKLALEPTSAMAMKNSRHPITEAGLDTIVEKLERALEQQEHAKPDLGKLSYGGVEAPLGYMGLCYKIVRKTPEGETWVVDFDKKSGLPAIAQARARNGELLERYVFQNVKPNLEDLASATAFDPTARWGASKLGTSKTAGFLQRLARGSDPQPNTEVINR